MPRRRGGAGAGRASSSGEDGGETGCGTDMAIGCIGERRPVLSAGCLVAPDTSVRQRKRPAEASRFREERCVYVVLRDRWGKLYEARAE